MDESPVAGCSRAARAARSSSLWADQQASARAAVDVFLASAYLFLALITLVWVAKAVDAGGAH